MGVLRVTPMLLAQRTLYNLNAQLLRLAKTQEQLSTGLRVNSPGDNPLDARRAIEARTLISQNEQFLNNMGAVSPLLTETSSTLLRIVDLIHRAEELTIQGANGTNGQAELNQIALEIDQLLEAAVVASNHQTIGRFIFSGTRTLTPAYAVTRVAGVITNVTFQGNANLIEVSLSEAARVTVNEPGSRAFQGTVDLFQLLINIRDELRAGDQASLQTTRLAELEMGLDQILLSAARIGAIENRIEDTEARTEDFLVALHEMLSDSIDADFTDTMVDLNAQSNAYQAALNAMARVIQPSLMDYIR